jgi:PBP1b-binding outer membrane lipoprotein LpoB
MIKKIIAFITVLSLLLGGCSASKEIPNDFVTPCPGVGCDFN